MSNNHDYVPGFKREDRGDKYLPRRQAPKIEKGQDFFSLTEKHGRPNGPFDKERKLPYRGA